MIRFLNVEDVLPIRNEVLRNGKLSSHECRFSGDDDENAFHLGYVVNNELASIATFHYQDYKEYAGKAYQLRGMATIEKYRSQGLGNQLVNYAIVYLRGRQVNYIWCNAREKAVNFYKSLGFEIISGEFQIPNIGPHYVMYVKIQ